MMRTNEDILTKQNEKIFRAKLSKGFRRIRRLGYFAKQNFWCCQTCAYSAIPEDIEKVVFYHRGDNDGIKYGSVFLAWNGDAKEIMRAFSLDGLMTSWNGDEGKRIQVTFLDDLKEKND